MAANRTERLLNLVICLLAARRFLRREQIRTAVPQYAACESDEAFERMFERDKDDLREMGIPLVTGSDSAWFEDEIGYRIPREDYALPDLTLSPEELTVLGLAARAWQQASLATAASQAVRKLEAGGADIDREGLAVVEPRVAAAEPAFATLYEAVRDRRTVRFAYRSTGRPVEQQRSLEPWGVVSWHGRWYVVGHDTDRAATRVFRLSRIHGSVTFTAGPGSVSVPEGLDLRREVAMLTPQDLTQIALVDVRDDKAYPLRHRAEPADASSGGDVARVPLAPGWSRLRVHYSDEETLAAELCGYGPEVVAVAPQELRQAVVRRLVAVAGAHQ